MSKSIEWDADSNLLGDANGDGLVSIADVMLTVNVICGYPYQVFFKKNADVNFDKEISISDVMGIVGIVIGR